MIPAFASPLFRAPSPPPAPEPVRIETGPVPRSVLREKYREARRLVRAIERKRRRA